MNAVPMLRPRASKPRRSQSAFRKRLLRSCPLYILMLPAIAATALFAYVPMYGIQIAFKDYHIAQGIWGSPWVGMQQFQRFITFPNFWPMIRNTLAITLYSLAVWPLNIVVALLINEIQKLKFKKTVQMISYAPHFLSTVVVCGMLKMFLGKRNGLINNLLDMLGMMRLDFMTLPSAFRHFYVWSGVWQGIGWGTIIYLAALSNVSQDQIEAARIDGASRAQVVWHVNLPAIMPTIVILFIMRVGGLLSIGFDKIYLLQNALNQPVSSVISTYVYEIGVKGRQFSYSTAIDQFNSLVNLITLMLANLVVKRLSGVGLW